MHSLVSNVIWLRGVGVISRSCCFSYGGGVLKIRALRHSFFWGCALGQAMGLYLLHGCLFWAKQLEGLCECLLLLNS